MSRSRLLIALGAVAIVVALLAWLRDPHEEAPSVPAPPAASDAARVEPDRHDALVATDEQADPLEDDLDAPERRVATDAATATGVPPAAARSITGRVVLQGTPPADEAMFVVADGVRHPVDAEGRFRAAFSSPGARGTLRLEARYAYLTGSRKVDLASTAEVVLPALLGGRVRGRLLGPAIESHELEAASLRVLASNGREQREGHVDADLRYEIGALVPDQEWAFAVSTGGIPLVRRTVTVRAGETVELDLVLARGVTLSGIVADENGLPLADARVLARVKADDLPGPFTRASEPTGIDGSFAIGRLSPGEYRLTIEAPGHRPRELDLGRLAGGEQRTGRVLELARAPALEGSVRWPDGRAASEATVEVGGDGRAWKRVEVDAEGRFTLAVEHEGQLRLRASADAVRDPDRAAPVARAGVGSASATVEAGSTAPIVLTLDPHESIRGRVVGVDREVTRSFDVVAEPRSRKAPGAPPLQAIAGTFSTRDGTFELCGLVAGEWSVRATARDHLDAARRSIVVPTEEPLELALLRAVRLHGRVVDADDNPLPGVTVVASWSASGDRIAEGSVQARSRGDGSFQLRGVAPAPVDVRADLDGRGETLRLDLTREEPAAEVVLRVRRPR